MDAIELLGPRLVGMLLGYSGIYLAIVYFPFLWPAYIALRRQSRLPRPLLFATVVAALVYGALVFFAFVLVLPAEAYGIFIAPQLEAANLMYGESMLRVIHPVVEYWWLVFPALQALLAWQLSARLARRWPHICGALATKPGTPAGATARKLE